MHQVNIAELKNRLSYYLDKVRGGEELIVCDRKKAIARIVPLTSGEDEDAELMAQVAAGIIKLPEAELPDSFWKMPRPRVDHNTALAAILAERDED